MTRLVTAVLTGAVLAYRMTFAAVLGGRCRFTPSCSAYALEALRRHGPVRGVALSAARIVRCNPLCQGGHDPVPPDRACTRAATPEAC